MHIYGVQLENTCRVFSLVIMNQLGVTSLAKLYLINSTLGIGFWRLSLSLYDSRYNPLNQKFVAEILDC